MQKQGNSSRSSDHFEPQEPNPSLQGHSPLAGVYKSSRGSKPLHQKSASFNAKGKDGKTSLDLANINALGEAMLGRLPAREYESYLHFKQKQIGKICNIDQGSAVTSYSKSKSFNKKFEQALLNAMDKGDIDKLINLLTQTPDINISKGTSAYLLHWSAIDGYKDLVDLLIERGANTQSKSFGRTPLDWAKFNSHKDIEELLAEKESKTTRSGHYNLNPFNLFNEEDSEDDSINDEDQCDSFKDPFSSESQSPAKLKSESRLEDTDLYKAVKKGLKALLEIKFLHTKDNEGYTILHWAAREGYSDILKLLIEVGADLNVRDKDGQTPLYAVAQYGQKNITKLLIDAGADLNVRNQINLTPLHEVAMRHYTDIAKLLIEANADPNAVDIKQVTPLHHAATRGYKDIVKLLIEAKADINAKDHDGYTPLDLARKKNHEETMKLLMEAETKIQTENSSISADSSIQDDKLGELSDELFERYQSICDQYQKILEALKEVKGQNLDKINDNIKLEDSELEQLRNPLKIELIKDKNVRNVYQHLTEEFNTALTELHDPLHKLVLETIDKENITNPIIKELSDIYYQNKDCMAALKQLILDIRFGYLGSEHLNIDVNEPYDSGETLLMYATLDEEMHNKIDLLLEKGADPCREDSEGNSALSFSLLIGNMELTKKFIQKKLSDDQWKSFEQNLGEEDIAHFIISTNLSGYDDLFITEKGLKVFINEAFMAYDNVEDYY